MPSPHPLVVPVFQAERSSGARPTEDRIFTTDNAVIVLDGATQPDTPERDGGWLADQLGATLAKGLTSRPNVDLVELLEDSLRDVSTHYDLQPGTAPSTTVAIVRWNAAIVDALLLCDSTIVARTKQGETIEMRDDRLAMISASLRQPDGGVTEDVEGWRQLVNAQRRSRNRSGGYWVAEAVPEAARHAVTRQWPAVDLEVVLVLTDGVSAGVEHYGTPAGWPAAIDLAKGDPQQLVDLVHAAEESDSDRQRWPRAKRHDDKALAVIRFDLMG